VTLLAGDNGSGKSASVEAIAAAMGFDAGGGKLGVRKTSRSRRRSAVARCDAGGIEPLPMPGLPTHLRGLVEALGEYQQAAADAAWSGGARDAVRALAAHPLVRSVDLAERLYGEMAAAHRRYLPERLAPA
jgi:Family 4 glycosyl hydrolase C-terminal domain